MSNKAENHGKLWSRDELILAFDLYCRIPFQKTKASNPDVRHLAAMLNRTPASVARKLGNFGSFDPELKKLSISGLVHVGHLDREVWEEFHKDWNTLVVRASELGLALGDNVLADTVVPPLALPTGPSERLATMKRRIHQAFFREAVLSSYEERCCVTGITIKECLVASHIVPWSVSESYRSDPTNGLCLSSTFDRLFDAGLMTLSEDLNVVFTKRIARSATVAERDLICRFEGKPIFPPRRFLPSAERLGWHRENVFKR